jgi:protein-S-isoprenylcysteine O-methyltransferase Ste14
VPWVIVVFGVCFFTNKSGWPLLPLADWTSYLACAFLAIPGMSLLALGLKACPPKILIGRDKSMLVTKGIYSYIRHPVCLSCVVLSFSVAIGFKSIIGLIAAIAVLAIVYLRIVLWEERELEHQFGQEYCEYKSNVGMFIPRLNWTPKK